MTLLLKEITYSGFSVGNYVKFISIVFGSFFVNFVVYHNAMEIVTQNRAASIRVSSFAIQQHATTCHVTLANLMPESELRNEVTRCDITPKTAHMA